MATSAAFIKESRIKFADATNLHGNPTVRGTHRSAVPRDFGGEYYFRSELPGGNSVAALVGGGVQHVDTPGVHMFGHLENSIEFVVQGRLATRSRQRIITRSQSNLVCTHNEYWYTSARAKRKCANLTITRPRTGQRASPLDPTPGYLGGEPHNPPPAEDGYLQQNRWQIGWGPGLPMGLRLSSL
jgi:hypothetical protein